MTKSVFIDLAICYHLYTFGFLFQYAGNILTDEELLSILLLVHNVSLVIHQAFPVFVGMVESLEGPTKVMDVQIGCAMGPWHTFMNHSCDPNSTKVVDKGHLLYCSVRSIKAGEQVRFRCMICLSSAP